MATRIEPYVAIWRDMLIAAFVASLILGVWTIIFTWFGDHSRLDSGFVTFLGGVLAISGLLFRQYMLKEVLEYLKSWDRMSVLLRKIIDIALQRGRSEDPHVKEFIDQEAQAHRYSQYVRRELALVPIVPLILIFLYGCAYLSENSLFFRETCLFLMIQLVAYLAIAAVTSTRIACAYPDLEKMIVNLEELLMEFEKKENN